jgi:hypothetical protein
MTWYQRKIWTSSGMLRKSSVHALPIHTSAFTGVVRKMPMIEPTASATARERPDTRSVQPHADIIQREIRLAAAGCPGGIPANPSSSLGSSA